MDRDNWEPRLSKLDQCVSRWKNRSLSLISKVLILNILGFSKLLFVSAILSPPQSVYDRINRTIWAFLWGSRIETVARKSLVCPETNGGLGLREFRVHGQASRLAILIRSISNIQSLSIFAAPDSLRLGTINWAFLRDNATPSALSTSTFYSPLLRSLRDLQFPVNFSYTSKEFYTVLLTKVTSAPILPSL